MDGGNVETLILHKVGDVSRSIDAAKCVDDVVCALHSLAVLLFPLDSSLLAGALEEPYRAQVLNIEVLDESKRKSWRLCFYRGTCFPAFARILIYNVASKWLACFPLNARVQVYDSFFTRGPSTETVQVLVPSLSSNNNFAEDVDLNVVYSNVERLLVLCLLENKGAQSIARELKEIFHSGNHADGLVKTNDFSLVSRLAQLVSSVPDKARAESPNAFSSHIFFKKIIVQLLDVVGEQDMDVSTREDRSYETVEDGLFSFIGQIFARICRRGSADILIGMTIPRVLRHIRSSIAPKFDSCNALLIGSDSTSLFWVNLMSHVKDQYAVERLAEELLRQLAAENLSDLEAYWILWLLFQMICKQQTTVRTMFVDKFLLWKVFPVCCLRWILHFSVFENPPDDSIHKIKNTSVFLETVRRLLSVWSTREFVQSAPVEQQAYITAAVGLTLQRITKEELESTREVLNTILQGVSCRLESPLPLVRKMASSIALVFSKIVDPNKPLYLDDAFSDDETIDWEFGLISLKKRVLSSIKDKKLVTGQLSAPPQMSSDGKKVRKVKNSTAKNDQKFSKLTLVDLDESADLASHNGEKSQGEAGGESVESDASSDTSLQPYDLSDDDTDLKKNFSQIGDIIAALRKPDDPDGVERALSVAERFIRASPDELHHNAADLVKTLVHIRCSDLTVEGEEDTAEEKRQKALVALLVTCPFESVDIITKLLYSSSVDVAQRIMIIDVMSDAAQELADTQTVTVKYQNSNLISTISDSQPWYLPSNKGPDGSSPWVEASEMESSLSWSQRFERIVPSKTGQTKAGKSRRWSIGAAKPEGGQVEISRNKFPLYAAAFMLPAMQGFDKKKHGIDFLGRDFIILGKLIYMLGVCMKCIAMHPEASALAPPLLDMLSSRSIAHHAEAYVRRSVLFAASCILAALHPSFVASALIEGDKDIPRGLEWIRNWALQIAESDPDTDCTMMAMTCLQLHAEMALQASRALESADSSRIRTGILPATKKNEIILPVSPDFKFNM